MNNKTLKICFICDARSIHYKRWIRDVQSLGHEVQLFSPWQGDVVAAETRVVSTPRAPFPLFKWMKTAAKLAVRAYFGIRLRSRIKEMKPDIVHAHFLTDSGWIGAWLGFHPFIVTSHGSDTLIHPNESLLMKWAVQWVLKRADYATCVSPHILSSLKQLAPAHQRIDFIPNYIDLGFVADQAQLTQKKASANRPVIICARRLEPVYDVGTFIKSIPDVIQTCPDARFIVVDDGSEKEVLMQLVSDLNVNDAVRFTGKVDHHQLMKLFKASHVYVSPAVSDGLSVTTLEAIVSGNKPVLTDIPANQYLFQQGVSGDIFPCNDASKLAAAIVSSIESLGQEESGLADNAALIQKLFSREKILNDMNTLYYKMVQ